MSALSLGRRARKAVSSMLPGIRETPARDLSFALTRYRRAADYLAAAQIYLQGNCLLEEPLRAEHIKPRLLGHWGTCPGISFMYAGLNRLIRARDVKALLVTGPGHGAPAVLANLWLEGSLEEIDDRLGRDLAGLERLVGSFSWPDGFPSHLAPMVPGVIHEGGELGYALATAFGAALDNPDLLVACIVGDGEAETGPTAAAWHSPKFVDPAMSGAVLPLLHLNGYKISSPTVFARMGDDDLVKLFGGYGWQPRIIDATTSSAPDEQLGDALDWAHAGILDIRRDARHPKDGGPAARWPLLIVRSPKGWGGIEELDGEPIEGTFRAHQVPAKQARSDDAHLHALEKWLRSYRPEELFDADGRPADDILGTCPDGERRMGCNPHANGGRLRVPLPATPIEPHAARVAAPGGDASSALEAAGAWLAAVVRATESSRNFRIVCPDELTSNKLDGVLAATSRAWQLPNRAGDEALAAEGRVLEVLSEHTCQGWLQGYLLTGRHGVFPCYEAFASIVDSMVNQYAKFLKMAAEVPWRAPVSSFNYLLTSEGWRQEHNGYSHQGPGFINNLLNRKASVTRIYLPPDANTLLVTLQHCLDSLGYINLVIASKQPLPQWLTLEEARAHCRAGASVWRWAGNDDDGEPDVVLAAAGTIPTVETVAAAAMLGRDAAELRVRVVNVCDLLALEHPNDHPHGLAPDEFDAIFTADKPVVFDFHGYPSAIHQLLYHRPRPDRFHVKGYIEEGTTTTPFDLLVANGVSRHHLAIEALRRAPGWASAAGDLINRYQDDLTEYRRHIVAYGVDPPEITDWRLAG